MTAPVLIQGGVGPALGRFACYVENAYRELVRGALELGEAGLEPAKALAELIEDTGDAAAYAVALADTSATWQAANCEPIFIDDDGPGLPPWVDIGMFTKVAAEYRAELRRRAPP